MLLVVLPNQDKNKYAGLAVYRSCQTFAVYKYIFLNNYSIYTVGYAALHQLCPPPSCHCHFTPNNSKYRLLIRERMARKCGQNSVQLSGKMYCNVHRLSCVCHLEMELK